MKVRIVIGSLVIAIVALFFFFENFFKEEYLILLKKDGVVYKMNDQKKLNGEVKVIKQGTLVSIINYVNGNKEGWKYTYYQNGRIMNKSYYHLNQPDGPELQYFSDGKLQYKMLFKKGKPTDEYYEYSRKGRILLYSAYDINGNPFCEFKYDEAGNIIKISPPVSLASYSKDTVTKKTIILTFEEKHKNIKDLYTNLANPPGTKLNLTIIKDGKMYNRFEIVNNILEIENPFPNKGLNKIYVKIDLVYRNKKIIENLTGDLSIIRE